jgi:hypothetical protein
MTTVPDNAAETPAAYKAPDKPVPDKHVEARMARIEAAVQRMQLFIVLVAGVAAILWCLDFAIRVNPDPYSAAWFYGGEAVAVLVGMGIAFGVAKLIGYPLQVLKRA